MKDSTSSADSVALKPCPFCGSEPWGVFGPHEDIGSFWVECHGPADDCMTCGDWYVHNAETREDAAIAWNRRALAVEEPKPQAEPRFFLPDSNGRLHECKTEMLKNRLYGESVVILFGAPVAADKGEQV